MKCIIIEDDLTQRAQLRGLLESMSDIKIEGEFDNPMDFLAVYKNLSFDLLFLDIETPKMTGIDFLNALPLNCPVIITTANKNYAYDVFNFNVSSYLLKPIVFTDLVNAVYKATHSEVNSNYLFVKSSGKIHKISYGDIYFVKGAVDYIEIFTKANKYLVNTSLNSIQNILPKLNFMRIHRSHIVNLDHISNIHGNYVFINDNELKISENQKKELLAKINVL